MDDKETKQFWSKIWERSDVTEKPMGMRVTGELLYIDQHILEERKNETKNVAMAWIDNKKAFNMVPQSRIIDCRKMYKKSDEVIKFNENTMENLIE